MASSEDNNFKSSHSTCSRGRSQMSVGKILDTISSSASAAAVLPNFHSDETIVGRIEEKRGLLDIDLNVTPPEECEFESPAADDGGNGQVIKPKAAAGNESGSVDERRLNLIGIQAHWSKSKVEDNRFCENMIADSDVEMEKDGKLRGWKTLLEVAESALREHEENQNLKRKTSREAELGGELTTRKKVTSHRRQGFPAEWIEETAAVVRSTRGRAVAMPNKYRDSVLDAVAEAEAGLTRYNKSGKSATVVSTKRKFR